MADNARGIHVSPGVYSREIDMTYAVKSLGITTLGLVGETQRGPAFQPMAIENWRDFQNTFGGTSTEKFKGSQYPKYELPYIAKSYLSESNQLQVCRVLGLSGYNAGPAWVLKAYGKDEYDDMVIAVIRSRGQYEKYHKYENGGSCDCPLQAYDKLTYEVGEIKEYVCSAATHYNMSALQITTYIPYDSYGNACEGYKIVGTSEASGETENTACTTYTVGSTTNYGRFKLYGFTGAAEDGTEPEETMDTYFEYPVTLNPNDKDYILKVLGTSPSNGEAPIYVESLYDVAYLQALEEGNILGIKLCLEPYQVYHKADYCALETVGDFITLQQEALSRKDIGKRFLADAYSVEVMSAQCVAYDYATSKPIIDSASTMPETKTVTLGQCYTVKQYTDVNGKRHYYYAYFDHDTVEAYAESHSGTTSIEWKIKTKDALTKTEESEITYDNTLDTLVKVSADGRFYRLYQNDNVKKYEVENVYPVTCDLNDYKESYRYASTPWIVSNVKGDYKKMELSKLFRFHTISDGVNANNEVKISIANIKYDDGIFDVIVRDINDTDASVIALEKFTKCTLTPGTSNYIGYKIGTFDGMYESKSKYITVEVNENLSTQTSVPAGFLGYPLAQYDGLPVCGDAKDVVAPFIKYNRDFDEDKKNRKQYFGLSNSLGVDVDTFTYKGQTAYYDHVDYLSQGFHLDSRLNLDYTTYGEDASAITVTVDGIDYTNKFDAVSTNARTSILDGAPVIGTEAEMQGSIYEYVDLRKFTVYFYGGFDGWDEYRDYRSNTDDFKMNKYKGEYNEFNGIGFAFNRLDNFEELGLTEVGLTSDWYAYLAAARQFANPESVDINVFATPGIDLFNNTSLCQEVIEMLEEERADSIYVATVPDKPFGASDYVDEMYTPEDMVYELEDTDIDSNYTCVYYPWVKYEDVDNNQYIYLPPTKDVVRNMAITDNTTYPWFAPAGISRGDVSCVRAHYITKLADEDVLYEGRINPVKTFASDGVKLWGQKNLQVTESQLNRIAVRRLLLRMRKLVAIACLGLIFEPNDATTKNKFLSTVTPILDNIRANRGISDYRIEVNDTLEARERRELPAKIYFKPYNALEYITLDFILTPEGVDFDAI